MLISEAYRQLNKTLHGEGSYGRKGDKWAPRVEALIDRFQPNSVLDYGCGQGALGRGLSRPIFEYDPAIPGKDNDPQPAELVVCTDVLEHIEPACLEMVLDHLQALATRCLFAVVSTRPAQKLLPDGRNAHLIVQSWPYWEEKLSARFRIDEAVVRYKEVEVVLLPL